MSTKSVKQVLQDNDYINTETGEITPIRYLPGYPLQYRFDASRGIININGEKPITKKGQAFKLQPVAFRVFQDDILNFGFKRWAEFFFLNEKNALCNLLVHGYSVENLMHTIQQMFYDNVNLCQVQLTIKPIEKVNKATGNKYFIAEFSYKELTKEQIQKSEALTNGLRIWREDTLTGDAKIEWKRNYSPPIEVLNGHRKEG